MTLKCQVIERWPSPGPSGLCQTAWTRGKLTPTVLLSWQYQKQTLAPRPCCPLLSFTCTLLMDNKNEMQYITFLMALFSIEMGDQELEMTCEIYIHLLYQVVKKLLLWSLQSTCYFEKLARTSAGVHQHNSVASVELIYSSWGYGLVSYGCFLT